MADVDMRSKYWHAHLHKKLVEIPRKIQRYNHRNNLLDKLRMDGLGNLQIGKGLPNKVPPDGHRYRCLPDNLQGSQCMGSEEQNSEKSYV